MIEFISTKSISTLYKKLVKIGKDREENISRINKNFGDPIELAKFYIEPNCQHVNTADENEDEPISSIQSPIFKTINNFFNGEFAIADDGRKHMFVLADAGMGKSSLLVMLRMAYLMSFWPKKYECELLKFGESTIDDIDKISNPRMTILLLDALDEDKLAWKKIEERVIQIISSTTHFYRVIITCRTQFFPESKIDPFKRIGRIKVRSYICPLIFLSFFNDEQVNDYLKKRFPKNSKKRKQAKEIVTNMGSLRFRPLLLAYIDGFLDSKITKWDEGSIYYTLIETWLLREERKIGRSGRTGSAIELFDACCLCAGLMQLAGSREIERKTLEKNTIKIKELELIDFLDIGGRSLLNVNSDGNYRFSHYTIQEYLLACGIIKGLFSPDFMNNQAIAITRKLFSFLLPYLNAISTLSNLNFIAIEFTSGQFSQKKFISCDFNRVIFTKYQLSNITFDNCKFINCQFLDIDFVLSEFKDCDFLNSPFDTVELRNSRLESCNFDQRFKGVIFDECKLINIYYYSHCIESSFIKSRLVNTKFDNSQMLCVTFLKTFIKDSSFINVLFNGCLFDSGEFENCCLKEAKGKLTKIENCSFTGTAIQKFQFESV